MKDSKPESLLPLPTAVFHILIALADRGCAVLVVSEDLEELFEISTALMVMARGRLSPRTAIADATMSQIGEWMSGAGL